VPPDQLEQLGSALTGRYTVQRELGRGGMATVYLADDLRHHRKVAIKVLRPELGAVLGPERFSREIRIAAGLTHPHILPLHDSGEAAGLLFYVMPYVHGESLRQRLARQGVLPVPEAARLLRDVADALAAAHATGVVHRDIKPDNILWRIPAADSGRARDDGTGSHLPGPARPPACSRRAGDALPRQAAGRAVAERRRRGPNPGGLRHPERWHHAHADAR
jgi:protein kinase-like protein